MPAASDAVLNVATPEPLSVPVPSVAGPSLKVTSPVATAGDTVAVNNTVCPKVDALGELASTVPLLAAVTVWNILPDELEPKFDVPL